MNENWPEKIKDKLKNMEIKKNDMGRSSASVYQNNKVDINDWEEKTHKQFKSPELLLEYLRDNKPQHEELVFTHGDYCLPNIFGYQDKLTGFIDLGIAGIADKWQDIALCIRSLWHNFATNEYDDFLLEELGTEKDNIKLNYYILLDELF